MLTDVRIRASGGGRRKTGYEENIKHDSKGKRKSKGKGKPWTPNHLGKIVHKTRNERKLNCT